MEILGITREQSGKYECKAANEVASADVKQVRVTVNCEYIATGVGQRGELCPWAGWTSGSVEKHLWVYIICSEMRKFTAVRHLSQGIVCASNLVIYKKGKKKRDGGKKERSCELPLSLPPETLAMPCFHSLIFRRTVA